METKQRHPLAELRARAGISQAQLGYAILAEGSQTTTYASRINAYENRGKRIPLPVAEDIAKVFKRGWVHVPGTKKRIKFKGFVVALSDLIDKR